MLNTKFLFPSTVMIEPGNSCNLKCKMCEAGCSITTNKEKAFMTPEQLKIILNKLERYVVNIVFQGDCEPTLNPHLPELIKTASEYAKQISIVSNGTLLNERKVRSFIENGLSWFAISIDDHRPEVYNSIRIGADYEKLIENLKVILKLRDTETPKVNVVVHKIVFPEDTPDTLKEFLRTFYCKFGVNKIVLVPLVKEGVIQINNWIEMRNRLENELLQEGIDINLRDFASYPYKTLYKYCGTSLFFVNHKGYFSPCGMHSQTCKGFGNLLKEELEDIASKDSFINYHKFWSERRYNDDVPEICEGCFIFSGSYFSYCLDEGINAARVFSNK
ncbi:MAG: radical SAM protein [Clostridia bacterium]|nr:radical SAM protein [Clostridia bacterium]